MLKVTKKIISKLGLRAIYSTKDPDGNPATIGEDAAQAWRDNFEIVEDTFEKKADTTNVSGTVVRGQDGKVSKDTLTNEFKAEIEKQADIRNLSYRFKRFPLHLNAFDRFSITEGLFLNEDGTEADDPNSITSDFIKITGGNRYLLMPYTRSPYVIIYDANKKRLRTEYILESKGIITTQVGDKYVRFSKIIDDELGALTLYDIYFIGESAFNSYLLSTFDMGSSTPSLYLNSISELRSNHLGYTNLINKAEIVNGYFVRQSDGTLQKRSTTFATGFIAVEPNKLYTKNLVNYGNEIAIYDKDKKFLRSVILNSRLRWTYKAKEQDAFVRLFGHLEQTPIDRLAWYTFQGLAVPNFEIPELQPSQMPIERLKEYYKIQNNLFDKSKAKRGYYINASGQLIARENNAVSDFIPVESGKIYTKNQLGTAGEVCYYDADKKLVRGDDIVYFDGTVTRRTPLIIPKVGECFVRFWVDYSKKPLSEIIFCEGSYAPSKGLKFGVDYTEKMAVKNLIAPENNVNTEIDDKLILATTLNNPYPQVSTKKNANQYLKIETYDKGNEALHPKVLYFKNGWKGWLYWLVCTPYKAMNEAIENPCIYVSQNGINWVVPDGLTNPIDDISDHKIEYNSDPHLVYRSDLNRLECWWRWVGRGNHPTKPNCEIIYRRTSKDGIVWSDRELCFEYANTIDATRAVISPAILFEDNKYKMWASHSISDPNIRPIGYWESSNGTNWTKIRDIDLGSVVPSHIDVIKFNGSYRMIVFDVKQAGFPYYYTQSSDNLNWSTPVKILAKGNAGSWDSGRLYRPSLIVVDGWVRLYYSAYSDYGTNQIGLIIFDNFNTMIID